MSSKSGRSCFSNVSHPLSTETIPRPNLLELLVDLNRLSSLAAIPVYRMLSTRAWLTLEICPSQHVFKIVGRKATCC